MSPAASTPKTVGAIDDSAAGPVRLSGGGAGLGAFIDEAELTREINSSNRNNGPHNPHPFSVYIKSVIRSSGVQDAQETREMASHICGVVARLPFLPDSKLEIEDEKGSKTTEFEEQVKKTARRAEAQLDSEMVWTASALKLSRAALELRKQDPDGSKGLAWVNDPLPGESVAA